MSENPLRQLEELGQSVWYDNIHRGLLVGHGLEQLIENYAVIGVTTNPTIFQKAFADTHDYDPAIRELRAAGKPTEAILDTLTSQDVAMAADILLPVYLRTGTVDGWVSIEVPATLAHDATATVAEVHRLRKLVGRPNVYVKIPATAEGVKALRELVAEGISINVTLMFSRSRYMDVMEAYVRGLEEASARRVSGASIPPLEMVHGVGSFFVSRVDTLVDKKLDSLVEKLRADGQGQRADELNALHGKAAVANAKLAYQDFLGMFSGPRWKSLSAQGARQQRPLWASTSTKNPAYRDVMYVEELIGPNTVNTMPESTLKAFKDHGRVAETLTTELEEAKRDLAALEKAGISMDEVTAQLEKEGVDAFAASYDSLVKTLESKM